MVFVIAKETTKYLLMKCSNPVALCAARGGDLKNLLRNRDGSRNQCILTEEFLERQQQ